jgi:hypothetical protein
MRLAGIRDPRLRADIQRLIDAYRAGTVLEATPPPEPRAQALDSGQRDDTEGEELLWELRRLLASSGGTIADVANALERRGREVDRKSRDLLQDEVGAIEIDIAVLKTLLSDPVDWDAETRRLLAGEVPPFEDHLGDDDDAEDD